MPLLGSTRLRTTAYHPIANGLIKCFRRQLKAALKSYPHPNSWTDYLPMVLLGIRTTLKQDVAHSTAELVYHTTLRLPGQFFSSSTKDHTVPDPSDYVTQLKSFMQQLQATPTRAHTNRPAHISDNHSSSSHVFVRCDSVRKPLQQPYDGPFKILKRTDKHFTVDIKGRQEVISVDCLKPAHLEVTLSTT